MYVFSLDDPKNLFLLKFYDDFRCILLLPLCVPTLKGIYYPGRSEIASVSAKLKNSFICDMHFY